MIIISCANPKGGVGKTTIATILATTLANKTYGAGQRVAVIDADPSLHLTRWKKSRDANGLPPVFDLISESQTDRDAALTPLIVDMIDDLVEAETADVLIIDLEGTVGEIASNVFSRHDLAIIPMSPSSMDAVLAAKASHLAKRMSRQYKRDIPYVFAFCRSNAAIMTHEHKNIIKQLAVAGEPVLDVELKERGAYRAIFTHGKTLDELQKGEASSLPNAITNAVAFTQCVMDYYGQLDDETEVVIPNRRSA